MSKATVIVATTVAQIPTAPVDGLPTTVYWNICGLGQSVRYALEAAGVAYADVRIDAGAADAENYKALWLNEAKPTLEGGALDFPNLPYFFGGGGDGAALTQSNAILKHVGRQYGLMEAAPERVDLLLDELTDLDNAITGRCYRDAASLPPFFRDELPARLARLDRCLGAAGDWLCGAHFTVADCKGYETLRKIRAIDGAALAPHAALGAYVGRVEAASPLAAYLASPAFLAAPFNNPHAQFTGP